MAHFVESEIKSWLEDSRPNLMNLNELLPKLAFKIAQSIETYRSINEPTTYPYGLHTVLDKNFK